MTLSKLSLSQIMSLVQTIKKPYTNRDRLWDNRRKVRFRQMDAELLSLPLTGKAKGPLLIYQTEAPNQEVHRRVKRLTANKPRIEVVVYDDAPSIKSKGQAMEDGLKALWRGLNAGAPSPDELATENQQADGVGILKLDFIPNQVLDTLRYYDPDALASTEETDDERLSEARSQYRELVEELRSRGEVEAELRAYHQLTEEAKKKLDVPFRLSSIDPRNCYWEIDDDGTVAIMVEVGKKRLHPLLSALSAVSDRELKVVDGRITFGAGRAALLGPSLPTDTSLDPSTEVEYSEIRTKDEIVIVVRHPEVSRRSIKGANLKEGDGIVLSFDNPFGPASTGYVLVPGDVTTSPDPAFRYQPPVLGTLSVAQMENILTTIRLSAAIDTALRDQYIRLSTPDLLPPIDASATDKTPETRDGQEIPQIPGEIRLVESPNLDLDKADLKIQSILREYHFPEVLTGDDLSAESGHQLAIQVSQADIQMVPYQNRRAAAIVEVLKACLAAVRYLGTTIYVRDLPGTPREAKREQAAKGKIRSIDPDIDFDFDLLISVGAETPVTRYARWAALQQRYQAGTLSFETLMESSDVEDPDKEIARIFEGQTLVAAMQNVIPLVVAAVFQRVREQVEALQKPPGQEPAGEGAVPPESGLAGGGGAHPGNYPIAALGRIPGVGMSPAGPSTEEYGPPVQEGGGDVGGTLGTAV